MILDDNEPCDVHRESDQSQQTVGQLLTQLQASEHDKFLAHLYQARKHTVYVERPNKGNKAIEREVISSHQVAQSLGVKGDFRLGSTCCGFASEPSAFEDQESKSPGQREPIGARCLLAGRKQTAVTGTANKTLLRF